MEFLAGQDPEVGAAVQAEYDRQRRNIELIASENFVSPAVLAAAATVLTNKYAEGYPGKRYYGGCQCVDVVEDIARKRACYPMVKGTTGEKSPVRIGRAREDTCPHCGGRMVDILVLDGRDERLRFLGLDGILTATCCPSCVGFLKGPAFNRFALDGGVEVFPSELFDGAEKTDCYVSPEEYKALTENPFVLGEAPVSLFYGAACQNVNTIGGFGNWVQDAEYATCPHCGKPMKYLAQIQWDTVFDCAEGTLYVEFCSDCQIVSMQHQQT